MNFNRDSCPPIDPPVEVFLRPLLRRALEEKIGVSLKTMRVKSTSSSQEREVAHDRINIMIPYVDRMLTWQLYFDSNFPELGPDFVFDDPTFLEDPELRILESHVPSLNDWDVFDEECLLKVLVQFLMLYKEHQIETLSAQKGRLQMEYSMLIDNTEICRDDIEVLLLPVGSEKPSEAKFYIRVAMDFSKLPPSDTDLHDLNATLLVTFSGSDWNRVVPVLILSRAAEAALGVSSANFAIPPFRSDRLLMDYVPEIKRCISEKINLMADGFRKRRDFISALILYYRSSLVEYDPMRFTSATLLLEHLDFFFFVHFNLNRGFPMEKPEVRIQSVYHLNPAGKPPIATIQNFQYSKKWDIGKMLSKIINHILEKEMPKFQSSFMQQNQN